MVRAWPGGHVSSGPERRVVGWFGWSADEQSGYTLLGYPGHDLLPAQQRPELIGSATAGVEGDHAPVWQTSRVPKARCGLLRCGGQIDVWVGVAWLT